MKSAHDIDTRELLDQASFENYHAHLDNDPGGGSRHEQEPS